jgi:hypothetical protein
VTCWCGSCSPGASGKFTDRFFELLDIDLRQGIRLEQVERTRMLWAQQLQHVHRHFPEKSCSLPAPSAYF